MVMTQMHSEISLRQLIIAQGVMNAAHFLALPVFALHFTSVEGVGAEVASFSLGLFLAVARLTPLLTGPLADRLGAWVSLRLGLTLRAIGLGLVPFADTPAAAVIAAAFMGLGVALQEPAVYGILGSGTADVRERALLKHLQALNFGCVVGPGLGLLLGMSTSSAFAMASMATGLVAVWVTLQSPRASWRGVTNKQINCSTKRFDWRYAAFSMALVPFWALFAQFFASLPILIAQAGGSDVWAQLVILINGIVGFCVVPVLMPILKRTGSRLPMVFGCALAAVSIAPLGILEGFLIIILAILFLSVAETVVASCADILTAAHADGDGVASKFGMLRVGAGIGTSLGAALGVLAGVGHAIHLVFLGLLGLLSCAAPFLLPRKECSRSQP